jgi:Kdo2-lipid IVA lauroyltransferase/acyltransferase
VRSLRYAVLRGMVKSAVTMTRLLPRRIGLALFGTIGLVLSLVPHADRTRTLRNLREVFGATWSKREIRRTMHAVYRELGKNLFDAFYLPRTTPQQFDHIVTCDPLDAMLQAYRERNGVIAITAHTGCFEMLLHFIPRHGMQSCAVGKKLRDREIDRIVRQNRSGDDIVYIDRSEPARNIIRRLREGRVFGALIDQDTAVDGVFAEFLGKNAWTPTGPVRLAMRMNIPLFVVTTARKSDNTHHVFIKGPIALQRTGDEAKDIWYNTTMINHEICTTIMRYPEQWVWMHDRWRRRQTEATIHQKQDAA